MYIYIYDNYINQKKYDSVLARIETRITDLGLNGKIIRLGLMNSAHDAIENEARKGAKTIVAVGNDELLNQAINSLAKLSRLKILTQKIYLGFIPIAKQNNTIAPSLGIEFEEKACDYLSARRIKTFDLGIANDNYFLSRAVITSHGTTVEIDKNYTIELNGAGEIGVINLPIDNYLPPNDRSKSDDGTLELFIKIKSNKKFLPLNSSKNSHSIFSFKKLRIINKSHPVILDGCIQLDAPVDIFAAREKINLIIGRGNR
jgi:hypothetical protein